MNFGAILDKWEKHYAGNDTSYRNISSRDDELPGEKNNAGERRFRLHRKKPDASIDLHGLNSEEAWITLDSFFEESRSKGYEKLLVIHGKGFHGEERVLYDLTRRFIENCSFAGESGHNPAKEGGSGVTWVILKEKITVPGK